MLIRSQDKKTIACLYNLDSIGVCCTMGMNHIHAVNGDIENFTDLGEYSTEEKAIKVLDMIAESAKDRFAFQNMPADYKHEFIKQESEIRLDSMAVFDMPKDEEVEA